MEALTIINQIGQTLTTSLHTMDVIAICRSILRNLRWKDLFIYDIAEICLWDTQTKVLTSILRLPENNAEVQAYDRVYHLHEGFTGWIAAHQKPLVIDDTHQQDDISAKVSPEKFPYHSYIGVPLKVGLKFIGTLELAAASPGVYSEQDITILEIITNQAAITIDHVRLFQETQRNVSELALLFDASNELSSTLSYNELLHNLSRQMLNAFPAEDCTIFSFDEATGTLKLVHEFNIANSDGPRKKIQAVDKEAFARVMIQRPMWQTAFKERRPIILRLDEIRAEKDFALLKSFQTGAVVAIPLVSRNHITGLLTLFSPDPHDFSEYQVQLAQSLANQANIALDNARLFSLTDQQLQNRIDELAGLQRVSRESNNTLDLDKILNLVLEEAMRVTHADFGNVNLYDANTGDLVAHTEQGEGAIETATNGQNGQSAGVANIMEQVLHTGRTILVSDVQAETGYIGQGKYTRSMVVNPIYYGGEPVGVINLESQRINFFNKNQLRYLEALANQAAVAIGNAQAYQEQKREREQASRRVEQLSRLSEISNAFRTNRPLNEVLEDIAYAILESVGYKMVIISLVNENEFIHHEVGAGIPITDFKTLQTATKKQPLQKLLEIMQPEFRIEKSYFIPAERKEIWQNSLSFLHIGQYLPIDSPATDAEHSDNQWHSDDLLFVPLVDTDHDIIGILTVEGPDNGERPNLSSIQTLEIFANQAATAIENARLFELERQRRQLADTLRGVAEAISSKLDFDELLNIVLQELESVVKFDSASVQRLQDDKIVIIGGHGWPDSQKVIGLTFPMTGHNPNRRVIETQEPLIIADVRQEYPDTFVSPPHENIRSWMGLPLTYGTNILGLISLDSNEVDFFTQEDAQVVLAFANQVAVAMQNARLFEEAKNQVRQLAALTDVAQALNRALDLNEVLNLVLDAVFELIGRTQGSIWLIDEKSRTLQIANTKNIPEFMVDLFNESAVTVDTEPFASVIESGEIQVVAGKIDVQNLEPSYASPLPNDVTYVPLKTEDRVIGILALESVIHNKNMLQLVETLADLAAIAIDNAQLVRALNLFNEELEQRVSQRTEELARTLEDLKEERDRVETLYQITRELSTSFDLDRILTQALNLINHAIGISYGSILLLDRNSGKLTYRAALGDRRPLARGGQMTEYSIGYGLAGKIMQERRLRIVGDLREESDWVARKDTPDRRSAIAVPLVAGEEIVGAMMLFHPEVNYFTDSHARLVDAAGRQVANAINNAELYGLITDQAKRLGVMLRTQAAETAKNEAILKGITDGVVVLDADRKIVLVNPKAGEILGIDPASVENKPLKEILGHAVSANGVEFTELFYDQLLQALDKIKKREQSAEFRLELGTKAVVVSLASVALASEELPSVVAVVRDVSREAEIDRIRKEFISTVSHELRTPLTSIKGYADLLISAGPKIGDLSPTQSRFVQVIQSNANRLTGLVNDILEISRIETGRIKLDFAPLNIVDTIKEVSVSFEGQLVQKSVNFSLDLPAELPKVWADKNRLVQILVNLIGNAWQYTLEGGDVVVRARAIDEHFVQIDVADTGIGITEADLKYIFDRFYRSERTEVKVVDGTGLGLSITQSFVEMHGGQIWVQSELDVGSTFSFTVPIFKDELQNGAGPALPE
ncbi:MAG: GAF domain-containing protein [Anaerolineae bacterium]|nr:GAF domain-containing protein [Anaerolineae bacterium]